MLEAQVEEGPGNLIGVEPRAFRASRLGGEAAGSLCLSARALSSVRGASLGFYLRLADLSALLLRPLRRADPDLPPV
jgi:hypothetical protein